MQSAGFVELSPEFVMPGTRSCERPRHAEVDVRQPAIGLFADARLPYCLNAIKIVLQVHVWQLRQFVRQDSCAGRWSNIAQRDSIVDRGKLGCGREDQS